MVQHANLPFSRWIRFPFPQQILMIANEMNRGKNLLHPYDGEGIRMCLERVLALLDLTISANSSFGIRRELLRLRELIGAHYLEERVKAEGFKMTFKALLLLHPESAKQIPFVLT